MVTPEWVQEVREGNRKQAEKQARQIIADGIGTVPPGEMARQIVGLVMAAEGAIIRALVSDYEDVLEGVRGTSEEENIG